MRASISPVPDAAERAPWLRIVPCRGAARADAQRCRSTTRIAPNRCCAVLTNARTRRSRNRTAVPGSPHGSGSSAPFPVGSRPGGSRGEAERGAAHLSTQVEPARPGRLRADLGQARDPSGEGACRGRLDRRRVASGPPESIGSVTINVQTMTDGSFSDTISIICRFSARDRPRYTGVADLHGARADQGRLGGRGSFARPPAGAHRPTGRPRPGVRPG
jgi:hypothetical protein